MKIQSKQQPPQSFLRWAGSKRQLVPVLSKFWTNDYKRYVEPFVGSACLFFHLSPQQALLGDINGELILMYKQIKSDLPLMLSALKKLKKSKNEYYYWRSVKPSSLSDIERAARFIYLNRYCFNGLYRTNGRGEFNVPYGGDNRGMIPQDSLFYADAKVLRNAQLVAGDFEDVLKKVKRGDFVYMDPPFSVRANTIFTKYDASVFAMKDIQRLRNWMIKLHKNRISFLVSYAESEEAELLREGFYWEAVTVRRSIAGFASKRKRVNEILIYNQNPN